MRLRIESDGTAAGTRVLAAAEAGHAPPVWTPIAGVQLVSVVVGGKGAPVALVKVEAPELALELDGAVREPALEIPDPPDGARPERERGDGA